MKKCFILMLIMISNAALAQDTSTLFIEKCSLCHGDTGKGDGKLAPAIRDPSPADFTQSRLSPDEIRSMIVEGGEANGRSPSMPPWMHELSRSQINQLVDYVYSLRNE